MKNYNPLSDRAEEFICHEEILETLQYADAHKDDLQLIEDLLEQARHQKKRQKNKLPGAKLQRGFRFTGLRG